MIGTLVVILPSDFTGGAIVIEHHDERVTLPWLGRQLTFVAFYADCHHEVRPVTTRPPCRADLQPDREGQASAIRTVLSPTPTVCAGRQHRDALREPAPSALEQRLAAGASGSPRLPAGSSVHAAESRVEPPEEGRCRACRGATRGRAASGLRDLPGACRRARELVLRGRGRHGSLGTDGVDWRWHDDEEPKRKMWRTTTSREQFDLIELLDSDVELRHWVASDGRIEGVSGRGDDDEVCYTKASNELEPFASEHEGYMGNCGQHGRPLVPPRRRRAVAA